MQTSVFPDRGIIKGNKADCQSSLSGIGEEIYRVELSISAGPEGINEFMIVVCEQSARRSSAGSMTTKEMRYLAN
jgi:hypothetical protein